MALGEHRVQSDDHHVQANLPAANTTTHTIRNKNIETATLACFLNSLRPSFTRVVRWKNTERTKRKIGIAAAIKAMILKIIVHCQCHVTRATSLDHLVGASEQRRGHVEAKHIRSLEIDHQFELGRLQHPALAAVRFQSGQISDCLSMSALCQKPTYAAQQMSRALGEASA
jgi:hypothetical protein